MHEGNEGKKKTFINHVICIIMNVLPNCMNQGAVWETIYEIKLIYTNDELLHITISCVTP